MSFWPWRQSRAADAADEAAENRRKHLEFLQGNIARMSSASAATKGWMIPVVTAVYGYALTEKSWPLAALGIVVGLTFAYVDARYLHQEQGFRRIYNQVLLSDQPTDFTMRPDECPFWGTPFRRNPRDLETGKREPTPHEQVWGSWSIFALYGWSLVVGALLVGWFVIRPLIA